MEKKQTGEKIDKDEFFLNMDKCITSIVIKITIYIIDMPLVAYIVKNVGISCEGYEVIGAMCKKCEVRKFFTLNAAQSIFAGILLVNNTLLIDVENQYFRILV